MKPAYTYYNYSYTIARTDGFFTELKNHRLNKWVEVTDAILWKRIQEEGVLIGEAEAGKLYEGYHKEYIQSQR